ncbi:MAG: hypothetical protein OEZ04_13935, partial [Nitrospinota bacterium]|nr:hypothetical protein [Nitrospinota bacterium]
APGKSGACAYTLEICYLGEGRDIPAKTFITTSEGVNLKSEDRILNCDAGWSHFFDGKADGAKSIMVGVGQATQFKARFVSKTPMRIR